jgi:ubiquitin C-terminal hydrolase
MRKLLVLSLVIVSYGIVLSNSEGVGLENKGNTCFMNAAVQAMYHIDQLTNFLIENGKIYYQTEYGKTSQTFAYLYIQLIKQLKDSGYNPIDPVALCMKVWEEIIPGGVSDSIQSSQGLQQDAEELIGKLLEHLADQDINREVVTDRYGYPYHAMPKTYVSQLFYFVLQAATTYKQCLTEKMLSEPRRRNQLVNRLSVEIPSPEESKSIPLTDCLKSFFTQEQMVGQECNGKDVIPVMRELKLKSLSEVLIIHLKRFGRFDEGFTKITCAVETPLKDLDMGPYLSQDALNDPAKYTLMSFVVHVGETLNSGHYIAYCKYNLGWYEYNDTIVTKLDKQALAEALQSSYILFYHSQTNIVSRKPTITAVQLFTALKQRGVTFEQFQKYLRIKKINVATLVAGINDGFISVDSVKENIEEVLSIESVLQMRANLITLTNSLANLSSNYRVLLMKSKVI